MTLLILIPLVIPVVNSMMKQESGVLHIVLCNEDNGTTSDEIYKSLLEKDSIIHFSSASAEEAVNLVRGHKADAAWILRVD